MELTKRQLDIVTAAIKIIARRGYQDLTTKNLAAELQLTEAALYRHFTNKNDLIRNILDYFQSISCEVLEQTQTMCLEPLEKVKLFVNNRYQMFMRQPDLAQVMFSEEIFRHDPGFVDQMQSIMHIHRDAVCSYLREAQSQGRIAAGLDTVQIFRLIVGSMRLLVTQWTFAGQAFDLEAEGTKLLDTIIELIEDKP